MTTPTDGAAQAPMPGLTAVAVAEVESALDERRLALTAKQPTPHAHSCTMTLIIAVEDEHDHRCAFDVVEQLAGKYPVRVITLQTTRARDEVLAWVNTQCEGDPAALICSEEIALQGGGDSIDRIVSAVRGMLVPDLPVCLWWRGNAPHGNQLWQGLKPMCDRIIVDSIRFGDGAAALDSMRRLVSLGGKRTSLRDLNWQRTAPWRAAIASCFDDREVLALLADIDRVSITYASGREKDQPSARALLVAGWLASRVPRLRGRCKTAPGKHWSDVEAGRVVAVTLTASTSKASLMFVRQPSPTGVEAQASGRAGEQFRRWTYRANTLTEAELLDASLETLGSDPIFESALEM
jgi:glucose-6-phosphate dehydrogenase assembly protein OpcA